MQYRELGTTGLRISAIGLGCNPFGNEVDAAGAEAIVERAIDLGVNYFDTAERYFEGRSEEYLGMALRGKRSDAIVATKFSSPASEQHIVRACEGSLRRLQTDYIDLYQQHTPDRTTPIEETLSALNKLVQQGKVRFVGCSNFYAWEVVEAHWVADKQGFTKFASCQDFYNLLYRDIEKTFVQMCVKYQLALIPYMPLAAGLLSGTYRRGVAPRPGTRGAIRPTFKTFDSDRNWSVQEALRDFADQRGWKLSRLALAWLLTRPMVPTVIAGADRPEHIEDNVHALEIQLDQEDLEEIDRMTLVDEDRTVAPIFRAARTGN